MKKFYTPKELIQLLGFSKNTIYRYLEEGKIKSTRMGKGSFRIPASEVEKWLGENLTPTETKVSPAEPHPENASKLPLIISATIIFILLFGVGLRNTLAAKNPSPPAPVVAGTSDSNPQ